MSVTGAFCMFLKLDRVKKLWYSVKLRNQYLTAEKSVTAGPCDCREITACRRILACSAIICFLRESD